MDLNLTNACEYVCRYVDRTKDPSASCTGVHLFVSLPSGELRQQRSCLFVLLSVFQEVHPCVHDVSGKHWWYWLPLFSYVSLMSTLNQCMTSKHHCYPWETLMIESPPLKGGLPANSIISMTMVIMAAIFVMLGNCWQHNSWSKMPNKCPAQIPSQIFQLEVGYEQVQC